MYAWDCACVLIHVLACAGMPTEISINLFTDHIRAEESTRGIRKVVPKNYATSAYMSLLTSDFIAAPFSTTHSSLWAIVGVSHKKLIFCLMKHCLLPALFLLEFLNKPGCCAKLVTWEYTWDVFRFVTYTRHLLDEMIAVGKLNNYTRKYGSSE